MTKLHVLHVPGADPDRDTIVAKLRDQADACVHEDPSRRGVMPTWLEALECATDTDTGPWSVIVQDDADPLPGWQHHLEQACTHSPTPILGLTHFGQYGQHALGQGVPYAVGRYLTWGGAIAYRRDHVEPLHRWASAIYTDTGYVHDDVLVSVYAIRERFPTTLAARALFDQPVKKSLLGHNTLIRRPAATISNSDGPAWSTVPRYCKLNRQVDAKMLELARTPV